MENGTLRLDEVEPSHIGDPDHLVCYFQAFGGLILGPTIVHKDNVKAFYENQSSIPVSARTLCKVLRLD